MMHPNPNPNILRVMDSKSTSPWESESPSQSVGSTFAVQVSMVQVYNDNVYDMLSIHGDDGVGVGVGVGNVLPVLFS